MAGGPFTSVVTSEAELRAVGGTPSELACRKQIEVLDAHARAFIAHAPFLLLATAGAAGRCDVSPRGDAPGFVLVLDDRHLAIPERPGNRRFDSLRNILENPHVGLIVLVPGREETLRVNGRACVVRDEDLLERLAVQGQRPHFAIGVAVEEVFLHCAKAFRRSGLWRPGAWPDLAGLPSSAQMFLDHARPEGMTVEDVARRLDLAYRTTLC